MNELIGTGHLARRLGCSPSAIKKWERQGRLVPAIRVLGSDRRVWRADDLATLEGQVERLMRDSGRRTDRAA